MEITFNTPALLFPGHQFIIAGLYQPISCLGQPYPEIAR